MHFSKVVADTSLGFLICIFLKEEWKISGETYVPECFGEELVFQGRGYVQLLHLYIYYRAFF